MPEKNNKILINPPTFPSDTEPRFNEFATLATGNEAQNIWKGGGINEWAHYTGMDNVKVQETKHGSHRKNLIRLSAVLIVGIFVLFSVAAGESLQKHDVVRASTIESFPQPAYPFPEINAHAYFVKIIGKDVVLAKQREWKEMPSASLTKLLTVVLAYENISVSDELAFSPESIAVEDKVSGALPGESFGMEDVAALAIIYSANDAALLIAERIVEIRGKGGFEDKISFFVELMNQKAREIGLKESHFVNPTGLDAESHFSTVEDLTFLSEYIWYKHPRIWTLSRTIETTFISGLGREYKVKNTNELLGEFPAILGGKTGFTDNAEGALILLYPIKTGDIAIMVILGSNDRFGDGRKIIQWLEKSF